MIYFISKGLPELIITIEEKIQNQLKKEECDRIIYKVINVFENES